MIMQDDKKKMATIIISRKKPEGPEEMRTAPENENGDEMDSDMGLSSAAEEIMSAMHSKDPAALKAALRSFIEMHLDEESEKSSESSHNSDHSEY